MPDYTVEFRKRGNDHVRLTVEVEAAAHAQRVDLIAEAKEKAGAVAGIPGDHLEPVSVKDFWGNEVPDTPFSLPRLSRATAELVVAVAAVGSGQRNLRHPAAQSWLKEIVLAEVGQALEDDDGWMLRINEAVNPYQVTTAGWAIRRNK